MTLSTAAPLTDAAAQAHQALWQWAVARSRAPRIRSLREFAEQEIIIPEGQFVGRRFRIDRQPAWGLLFDAIDSGAWSRVAVLACVQMGKSLNGYVIPTLYHLFELNETVICGLPTIDMAKDKWREEILPAIAASRYRRFLPPSGPGSRGGHVEAIEFTHGPTLKFMSGHGGDEKRSGFTSRVVVITEADKMDTAGKTSREADPIRQLEARTRSYDLGQQRVQLECTVSIDSGAIWREYLGGTESRIHCPCPHCGEFTSFARESLVGWQDAPSAAAARRAARFHCARCGEALSEAERKAANHRALLVHRGQAIDPAGRISGAAPETDTLGFRADAFNNLFWSTAAIATAEWEAPRSRDPDSADKELCQFYWSTPYRPPQYEEAALDARVVAERKSDLPESVLPRDTKYFTIGIDLGRWQSWYLCLAFGADFTLHVPDYGVLEVHSDQFAEQVALLQTLRSFRDRIAKGWALEGTGQLRLPDRVWIDSGYLPGVVFDFLRETANLEQGGDIRRSRYLATLGVGVSQYQKRRYRAPKRLDQKIRKLGDNWHVAYEPARKNFQGSVGVDYWKLRLQNALRLPPEQPGALSLFAAGGLRHNKLARHLTSEHLEKKLVPGEGLCERWIKQGDNHWLDCAVLARAAGDELGFRLSAAPDPAPQPATWFGDPRRQARGRGEAAA